MKYVGVPWVEILFCSYELFYFYYSCYFCVYFVLLSVLPQVGAIRDEMDGERQGLDSVSGGEGRGSFGF